MTKIYGSVQNNAWHSSLEYYVDDNGYDDVYVLDCTLSATEISNLNVIALGDGVDAFGSLKNTLAVTGQSSVTKTANGPSDGIGSAEVHKVYYIDKAHSAKTITVTGTDVLKNGRLWNGSSYSSISGTSTVTKTLTVPAKTSYSVTYNANGGSGALSSQTKWYGETLTLSSTKPTRSGWTFVGWAKSASATSAAYAAGASYTGNAALALYAVWKKTITVSYNANNGTGAPSSQSVTIYNAASSGSITLTTTKPTRAGFKFVGWAISSSASAASYQSGTACSFSENTTLYAVWSATLTISSLTAIRCDSSGVQNDDGTYTKVICNWYVDSSVSSESTSITGSIREDGTSTSTAFTFSPASGTGSVTSEAIVSGVDVDGQYVVLASVSATSGGATQTATRSCLLTKAKFTMDWKQGGEGIGIFIAAPSSGLEVGSEAQFDNEVKLKGNNTRLVFEGPVANHSTIIPRIEAYDTNSTTNPRTGMNLVFASGGNLFLGGGESPDELYKLTSNGATDLPSMTSESPVLSADSYIYLFSNCNTIANRQRIAFGGSAGLLEIPGNLRLVNKTEMPTYYPNARARTDLGYVYGDHVRFRSREYALDNEASTLSAQQDSVPLEVTDVDNRTFARFLARQQTSGRVRAAIEAMGHHTGSNVWNSFGIEVRPDGSQHYFVTNGPNFREDLGISNASNLASGTVPTDRLPTIPIAKLPTITVAKGGTGGTTAAQARANIAAIAADWTQIATTSGTTKKTFNALNEAGYKEVLVLAYHSTDYWGSCFFRVANLSSSAVREFYMTGGNISASSGRRACCKIDVSSITPYNIWIDNSSVSGNWVVYARS